MNRRPVSIVWTLLAVAVLFLAQLAAEAAGRTVGGTTVHVTITDAKVTLSPSAVRQGKVVFRILDKGSQAHAFAIGGSSTPLLHHDASAELTVSFTKAGKFRAVARTGGGKAFGATLAVGSPPAAILPPTATSPTKTSPSTTTAPSSACTQPVTTTVTVTIVPPKFNFSRTTIPCGTVTFIVTNTGQLTHSLQITAPAGAPTIPTNAAIQPGQTQTFTVNMTAKGIYPWQCGEREDYADDGEYGNLSVQ